MQSFYLFDMLNALQPTKQERLAAGMYDYLMNKVGDRGWAMYQFYEREQRVYGIRSSNIVEGKIANI